ncbi:MAG: substrate-binding domain-containing protein, partial [Prevotellaceae bacterium]|nr:substrate-binding domain-containing protein [Prevotellaceae bacterium]
TTDYSHFVDINNMGIPLVFFARTCLPDMFSSVVSNGDEAAMAATLHMIDSGCKRIAFIGGPNHLDMVRRRKHGYLEALRERKIEIDRTIVVNGNIDYEHARESALRLLKRDDRPDAILAFNDIITYAAFDAVNTLGLKIPDDVAIMGFSETDTSMFTTPKLSVIMDQAHLTGERTCELLLKNIAGDKRIYKEIIPMKLEIRESSVKKKS